MDYEDTPAISGAARVLTGQYTEQRASQCDVNSVGQSTHWYCPKCCRLVKYSEDNYLQDCAGHGEDTLAADELAGLQLYPEFVDDTYESALVHFLDIGCKDRFEGWKDSQGGKRKQDYGPQPNFKKKKVKAREDLPGAPVEIRALVRAVEDCLTNASQGVRSFVTAQVSALEYLPGGTSFLNPHIDDTWLWGDRVVGVSLLSDCKMTFVTKSLRVVDVPLPRRAMFVLSGPSRYEALHGIRCENVHSRRLSITIRELSEGFVREAGKDVIEGIHHFCAKFV